VCPARHDGGPAPPRLREAARHIRAGLYYTDSAKSMGKRELLLMLAFVAVGAAVYRFTAPPAPPGSSHFSVSGIVDHARRAVRGNMASTEIVKADTLEVDPGTTELRLEMAAQSLTVLGEDRTDIATEVKIWSNGFDDAEAKALASQTELRQTGSGARMALTMHYPEGGRQQAQVTLKVPSRLTVVVNRYRGEMTISHAADVELVDTGGDVVVSHVSGRVSASHRGGELTVSDTGGLKLLNRGADVRITRIAGGVSIQTQGGSLEGSDIVGPVDIESTGGEFEFEKLGKVTGPVRINATGGSIRLRDLAADTRIDGRGTDVDVTLARPAPVGIYGDGQATIDITPAPGGYTLDARATNGGRIVMPEGTIEVASDGTGQEASGDVLGGGPVLTLRSTRGEIVVHAPQATPAADTRGGR
jgi:hypothetical protein